MCFDGCSWFQFISVLPYSDIVAHKVEHMQSRTLNTERGKDEITAAPLLASTIQFVFF